MAMAPDDTEDAGDHEGVLVGQQVEVKDEEDRDKGREGAGLAEAGQASERVADYVLRGEAHAERILGLEYGVHAEAAYEYPGDHRRRSCGGAHEPVSDGHEQHGAHGEPLQRDPVEQCHEQDK